MPVYVLFESKSFGAIPTLHRMVAKRSDCDSIPASATFQPHDLGHITYHLFAGVLAWK